MSLQKLLADLQKDYLASFQLKMTTIDSLWKIAQVDQKFADLETEYHKLKGTGRTYGLPEVTQLGEALERLCEIDRDSLQVAVPLSLRLLALIQETRDKGQPLLIEAQQDFRVIRDLVIKANLKTAKAD